MKEEDIVDAEFEEVPERDVIRVTELPEEDIKKIQESEAVDPSPEDAAEFAKELEEAQKEIEEMQKPKHKLSQREMVEAVNRAVAGGIMPSRRKARLLQEMGIYKSTFTKKQKTKTATAKKRKQQKNARRKNRK
jgi:hypothetical protein